MKTKFILAIALMASMLGVNAQFIPGPASGPLFSTYPVTIPTGASNFAGISIQNNIPVGQNGVGLCAVLYAPNTSTKALVVTNCQWLFQGSANGSDWINLPTTASAIQWTVTPNADAVYTVYTNFIPTTVAAQNIGNLRYIRPTWFTNGNGTNQITLSNAFWTLR